MSGILFFRTGKRAEIREFYIDTVGAVVWLEQAECTVLKHGNLLLGFCDGKRTETEGVIAFFTPDRDEVDRLFDRLKERATTTPKVNDRYGIYHFHAEDPDGRVIEFQTFLHPVPPYRDGADLLASRRSVRRYTDEGVPEAVLDRLFELSTLPPSSHNRRPSRLVLIRDREKLEKLAEVRGGSSAPIGRAPLAVAVCVDTSVSGRPEHDGAIAAYHFLLAAKLLDLGTCWVTDMDRPVVREMLRIPEEHRVIMITPLGWPGEDPPAPRHLKVEELLRVTD